MSSTLSSQTKCAFHRDRPPYLPVFQTCAVIVSLALAVPTAAAEPTWEVHQISTGSDFDTLPDVSGTSYVWQRRIGSGKAKIMMWTEGDPSPTEISDTERSFKPRISNGRVVWQSKSSSSADSEIMLWENGVITPLTDNTDNDTDADIGGYGIVWRTETWYLTYFDGTTDTQIDPVSHIQEYPRVTDGLVVWEEGSADKEIYTWSGGVTTPLTDNAYNDVRPETDGETIVWSAYNGPDGSSELWRWTADEGAVQITDNSLNDDEPAVSGDVIAFTRFDDNDLEVFFRYQGVEYQITDNDHNDSDPAIEGDRIVWAAAVSSEVRNILYAILSGLGPGEIPGACCIDLDCQVVTESECDMVGGVFRGEETVCDVDACGFEPALGWSTYQHDYQRTGRTDAIVGDEPSPIWKLLVSSDPNDDVAPVIASDGTVYSGGGMGLVAVNNNGTLRWTYSEEPNAPAAIRRDLNFFLPGLSSFSKRDYVDGSGLCGVGDQAQFAPALDSEGNCYFITSNLLRKMTPSCDVQWTYNYAEGFDSHIALGDDGAPIVARDGTLVKLDPVNGDELWTIPIGHELNPPSIADDGTIHWMYKEAFATTVLMGTNPDGSEKWSFTIPSFRIHEPYAACAVGADGTVYAPGIDQSVSPEQPGIVAVSAAGAELWRFSDSEGYDAHAPVIDGIGTIFFTAHSRYLIAVSPSDGSELWRVDVGEEDEIIASPAIAKDGTIYVRTRTGYLIALSAACPDVVDPVPYYSFRRVATEGDLINGETIDALEQFILGNDGLVSFLAHCGPSAPTAVFTELAGGGFDSISTGSFVDGYEMDRVALPRRDDSGNVYMGALVVGGGPALFVNNTLYVAESDSGLPAPVLIERMDEWEYVDPNNAGHMLLWGSPASGNPRTLYSIDTSDDSITEVLTEADMIEGLTIEEFTPAWVDGYGDDGLVVLWAILGATNDPAIVTPSEIVAIKGDVIDGYTLSFVKEPRRTTAGDIFYLGESDNGPSGLAWSVFAHTAADPNGAILYGDGSVVNGQPILAAREFGVNDLNQVAYSADILGQRTGIFVDEQVLAIEDITTINGVPVYDIKDGISINNSGQVAFIAQRDEELPALFVGTPVPPLDGNRNGKVDLPDLEGLTACMSGPGDYLSVGCGIFDANGDCAVDLNDFGLFQLNFESE